jgi:3-deoxy-manno-octulosonate cytidylyltransferase (CMP-KDO synthetase)
MLNQNNFAIVIPARYKSSRLPYKILESIHGHPMIFWTYHRACLANLGNVLVAADDENVYRVLDKYNIPFIRTSSTCRNGTDRVSEVSSFLKNVDFFINIQCDEPLLNPQVIIDIHADGFIDFGFKTAISEIADGDNPNEVKVALSDMGRIRFASRAPIPYSSIKPHKFYKIHGIYSYSRVTLQRYVSCSPKPLEISESIEQLRCIEYDMPLFGVKTAHTDRSVDTYSDLLYMRSKPIDEFQEWFR